MTFEKATRLGQYRLSEMNYRLLAQSICEVLATYGYAFEFISIEEVLDSWESSTFGGRVVNFEAALERLDRIQNSRAVDKIIVYCKKDKRKFSASLHEFNWVYLYNYGSDIADGELDALMNKIVCVYEQHENQPV